MLDKSLVKLGSNVLAPQIARMEIELKWFKNKHEFYKVCDLMNSEAKIENSLKQIANVSATTKNNV